MYAIVDIAGQQFKVEQGQEVFVHRLEGDEGAKLEFEKVLLLDNNGKVSVGTPVVKGAKITAKLVEHLRGDKVVVFHKKRRKGYQKANGHRQDLSKVLIEKISMKQSKTKKEE
jgi:large subunit ribosomal protein L21